MRRIVANILSFFIVVVLFAGCGSNYYAEKYVIHTTQKELVRKIDSFKNEHPEYRHFVMIDGKQVDSDHPCAPFQTMGDTTLLRYVFSFRITSENMIFQCNILNYDSLDQSELTTLNFIAVTDTAVRNAYTINTKDLSMKDNNRYKRVFEKEILDNLGVVWENKGRW